MPISNVTFHSSHRTVADPSAVVAKSVSPEFDGHLYRWKAGDTLSLIAVKYLRDSTDWKVLYALNHNLYSKRHNKIQEGDLIKIPQDWLPLRANVSYDHTKVEARNQDLQRESYLLKMYGQLKTYKENADDD